MAPCWPAMNDFNQEAARAGTKGQFPKRNLNASKRRPELPADLIDGIDGRADILGYGKKGRVKLLRVVLDVIDSMPALFRKR
jgi:hypothetical protein